MALTMPVKDGQVVYDNTTATVSDSTSSYKAREVSNTMDKDAFLQLLVAQMKYQDPLEPTDNTEYVAQLATFSELEAMTNLNESMSIARASQLVGQKVTVETTASAIGDATEVVGTVDYVMIQNNKAYLVIDGDPYSIDNLTGVMTEDYWNLYQESIEEASQNATTIMAAISTLPENTEDITLGHADFIKAIRNAYDALPEEEKMQVSTDYLHRLIFAEYRIAQLEAEAARNEAANGSGDATDDTTDATDSVGTDTIGDEAGTTA